MSDDKARGFRSIGSLTSTTASTPEAKGSTPASSPRRSEISGTPKPGLALVSSTGTPHGVLGAATKLPARLAQEMAGREPDKTDEVILTICAQQLGSPLGSRSEEVIDPVYGWDSRVAAYRMPVPVTWMPMELERARRLVLAALQPAPPQLIVAELARLRTLTKSRPEEESVSEASYAAYTDELGEFPPDAIRAVCRGWMRQSPWFPAFSELFQACEAAVRNRRLIAHAISAELAAA